MNRKIILSFLVCLLSLEVLAYSNLSDKNINDLSKKISALDRQLNNNNVKYLSIIKRKNQLEQELYLQKKELKQSELDTQTDIKKINETLKKYIVTMASVGHSASSLIAKDLILKQITNDKKVLVERLEQIEKQEKDVVSLIERLNEYSELEKNISEIVSDLEQSKENYAKKYIELQNEKNLKKKQQSLIKAQKIIESSVKMDNLFQSPIENFISVDLKKKKGITFTFSNVQAIKIPQKGKILFAGDISPYGNVIMISHDNNMQSVILGEIVPKVTKGDIMNEGDILGYTKVKAGSKGKMYFEIRKNNKVVETVKYMNRKNFKL